VEPRPARKLAAAALATVTGVGAAVIAWAVMTRPFESISPYYLARSLPEGGGSNAVNVIIVDFRGFDTLGEIAVLGIAGLIVFALLSRFRVPATFVPAPADSSWNPLLLQVVTRTLLPLAAMVSVYLLLRGHNLPGGGFIAGLVLAAAVMIVRVAGGTPLPAAGDLTHSLWIGGGLLIAGLTGLFGAMFGRPFLTSAFGHPVLPMIGELPLATAALFDLGVYLTVIGATLLVLMTIAVLRPTDPGSAR
jgi:multicomponent K+:H+ antiporter subunit A